MTKRFFGLVEMWINTDPARNECADDDWAKSVSIRHAVTIEPQSISCFCRHLATALYHTSESPDISQLHLSGSQVGSFCFVRQLNILTFQVPMVVFLAAQVCHRRFRHKSSGSSDSPRAVFVVQLHHPAAGSWRLIWWWRQAPLHPCHN